MQQSELSEPGYRSTLDNLLEGCQILDFDWKYLYLNAAAARHNRRPNSDLLGRKMADCWPGIDQTDLYRKIDLALQQREAFHQELDFHFQDGSVGWFEVRASPIPEGVFLLSIDITERIRQTNEAHRLKRLYSALSQVNQAIVRIDNRQALFDKVCETFVNDAGLKMAWIGWPDAKNERIVPAAVFGDQNGYLDAIEIRTDNSPQGSVPVSSAFKQAQPQVCNDMLAEPSLMIWREKILENGFRSKAAFPIEAGGSIGVLVAYAGEKDFFRDKEIALMSEAATDVAFALQNFSLEEERKALANAASRENRFARAMMESMPGIIYFYRKSGQFLRWNKNFELISGYSHAEIAMMHPLDFFDDADKDLMASRIAEVFEHGESAVEAPFRTKSGKKLPYYFTGQLIEFEGEQCLIGTGVDIALLKNAQNEILRLNTELEQRVTERTAELAAANRELEAFSYSVSHDLRSPLRAINGFAEIVLNKFGELLPKDGYDYLRRIRNAGHRMGELIDDLLTFSRLSRESLSHDRINMGKLAQSAIDEIAPLTQGRSVNIQLKSISEGYGDAKLLRQVWLNLIGNAVKYTRNCEHASIIIGSEEHNGATAYFIKDNGVGFNMAYASKLFGVFQRLHRDDEFEGTGVGLAIVQRVIHRHGGKVWAEAEEGKGAIFWFTLGRTEERK